MAMAGPWIADAMARDRYLPSWARWRAGRWGGAGPVGLLVGVALILLITNTFELMLNAVGVTLALFGALSASAILKVKGKAISKGLLLALVLNLLGVIWSVTGTLIAYPMTLLWTALTLGVATLLYFATARRRRAPEAVPEPAAVPTTADF
jgi:hypothetical protein